MDDANAQNVGPDFSKFKNIPPAFAGTIIDWSMGSREITSTVIDLILRDYLSVIDTKVIRNKKSKPLKNFENKFINTIFGQSESLSFEQFSQIAFKKEFDNILKIIADGMIEEGYVDKDFQEKMTNNIKESVAEIASAAEKIPEDLRYSRDPNIKNMRLRQKHYDDSKPLIDIDLSKGSKPAIVPDWVGKLIFYLSGFAILVGFILTVFSVIWKIVGSVILFFAVPIFFVMLVIRIFAGKIKKGMENRLGRGYDWALTINGQNLKKDSLGLKQYMETYPLLEDRLANELVAFAISFGLGKVWLTKIGKFNANLKLFIESMNTEGSAIVNFMDVQKFVNAFENKQ